MSAAGTNEGAPLTQNHELPSQLKAMIVLNRYFIGSAILAMELFARKVMPAFAYARPAAGCPSART